MFIFKVGRWVAYAWNPESSTPALGLKGFLLPLPHSVFFFFFKFILPRRGLATVKREQLALNVTLKVK